MSRPLSKEERIQARHLLQVLSEHARSVRDAIEPHTGILSITDEAWCAQWAALTRDLDAYTENVKAGRPPYPYTLGDRNAGGDGVAPGIRAVGYTRAGQLRRSAYDAHAAGQLSDDDLADRMRRISVMEQRDLARGGER